MFQYPIPILFNINKFTKLVNTITAYPSGTKKKFWLLLAYFVLLTLISSNLAVFCSISVTPQLISYVGKVEEPPVMLGCQMYAPTSSHNVTASPHIIPAIAPYFNKDQYKVI